MIFDVELDIFDSRFEVIKEERGKHRILWHEGKDNYTLYLADLDGSMLRTTVSKNSMDKISTYNFIAKFCKNGIKVIKRI